MADSTILPGQRAALVDRNGVTSPEFYRFFRSLSVTADLPARVDDLTVRVATLEDGHGEDGNVVGKQSIASSGMLSNGLVTLRLDGDVDSAPALSFYGAIAAGVKGWQTLSGNFATLDNGDGTYSLDLADLANSGTGAALVKLTRDAKGRISGTEAATTDDLTEGLTSLYFTAARVRASVLTGLSLVTSAVIAATDTVLGALGKLQAQITNLLPLDGSKTMTGTLNIRATGLQINMGVDHSAIAIGPIQSAASDGNLVNENISCSDTVAFAPRHNFYRGRGTNAVSSDVFNGDTLGGIQMIARVGGAWQNSASILSAVDGAPGASFAPGMLQFSTSDGLSIVTLRWVMRAAGHLQPAADNVYDVGSASTRTRVIYAGTGSINTSDARDKTSVTPLSEPELAASIALSREIGTYQWLSSVQAKGADARWHAGLTVQRAIEIMQSHGLDPFRYGFICYDRWDEQPEIVSSWPAKDEVLDEAGNVIELAIEAGSEVVQPYRPAGDRYSFRHDELLLFMARGIDARLSALEART